MAGRGPGGSGADPESRPEPLVGLNGQVVVRVVADDARAGEVDPGGRGLVVLVRGPAIQPADEKGRTLLGSRTAPCPTLRIVVCLLPAGGSARSGQRTRPRRSASVKRSSPSGMCDDGKAVRDQGRGWRRPRRRRRAAALAVVLAARRRPRRRRPG